MVHRRARAVLPALALLVLLAGAAEALQGAATVGNARPAILSWDVRATPCGPGSEGVADAGLRVCAHARDGNGSPDLCGARAAGRSRVTVLLASGQAWSAPLACSAASGRDAWMEARLPPEAGRAWVFHLAVEDAWGAASVAPEAGAPPSGAPSAGPAGAPDRHAPSTPSRRAGDLLP